MLLAMAVATCKLEEQLELHYYALRWAVLVRLAQEAQHEAEETWALVALRQHTQAQAAFPSLDAFSILVFEELVFQEFSPPMGLRTSPLPPARKQLTLTHQADFCGRHL
jgi:hypothetical protein